MRIKLIRRQKGFTLLELLVVLAIIGLLAGLVGPRLFDRIDQSSVETARVQAQMLRSAVLTMRLDIGRIPTEQEGLELLVDPGPNPPANWRGPYLDGELPLDPWGNPYQYSIPGERGQPFALYSFGADGRRGGEGDAADIGVLPPDR